MAKKQHSNDHRRPQVRAAVTATGNEPVGSRSTAGRLRRWVGLTLMGLFGFVLAFGTARYFRQATPLADAPTLPDAPAVSTDGAAERQPQRPKETPAGMVWIAGGQFTMGTDLELGWPDEKPAHQVRVAGFFIDLTEVTNQQFQAFVDATGYQTTAERAPLLEEIMSQVPPGTPPPDPALLVPGSMVFVPPATAVPLNDFSQWWQWTPGASWRHPEGPASDLTGREDHPVVQVSWDDAAAYAKWAKKRLPAEAEWEFAARGGLDNQPYGWGAEPPSDKQIFANIWQGTFPNDNTGQDGFAGTAPVRSFPANGHGVYDMAGNVWEWCADFYDRELYQRRSATKVTVNPTGPSASFDPNQPYATQRVQRGGSFLCNDSYCSRYRPSARHGSTPDSGMSHVGFRCAASARRTEKPEKAAN